VLHSNPDAGEVSLGVADPEGIPHVSNKYPLPVYFITRGGMGFCVRPNRYALALATGSALGAYVFALHECDNPVCVKVSGPEALCEHVVAGTQFDNMRRMARARRGGARPTIRGLGREVRRACERSRNSADMGSRNSACGGSLC
jgi:hypothetical protein